MIDACASCLSAAVIEGGACASDQTFQTGCIADEDCRRGAQCLAFAPTKS